MSTQQARPNTPSPSVERELEPSTTRMGLSPNPICAICLENLIGLDEHTLTEKPLMMWSKCGHVFHASCIYHSVGPLPRKPLSYHSLRIAVPCSKCPGCGSIACSPHCRGSSCDPISRVYLSTEAPSTESSGSPLLHLEVNGQMKQKVDLVLLAQSLAMETDDLIKQLMGYDKRVIRQDRQGWFAIEGDNVKVLMEKLRDRVYDFAQAQITQGFEAEAQNIIKNIETILGTVATHEAIRIDNNALMEIKHAVSIQETYLSIKRDEHAKYILAIPRIRTKIYEEEKAKSEAPMKTLTVRLEALELRNKQLVEERRDYTALESRNDQLEIEICGWRDSDRDHVQEILELKQKLENVEAEKRSLLALVRRNGSTGQAVTPEQRFGRGMSEITSPVHRTPGFGTGLDETLMRNLAMTSPQNHRSVPSVNRSSNPTSPQSLFSRRPIYNFEGNLIEPPRRHADTHPHDPPRRIAGRKRSFGSDKADTGARAGREGREDGPPKPDAAATPVAQKRRKQE